MLLQLVIPCCLRPAIDAQMSSATPPRSPTLDWRSHILYDSDSDTKTSDLDLDWDKEPPAALVSVFWFEI